VTDPWEQAEAAMKAQGFDLDRVPAEMHQEHLWSDGILLFWTHNGELPTPVQLAEDMFDEWDDPVSTDECEKILKYVKGEQP